MTLDSAAEASARLAIIAEARSWIGTPYHYGARVKGPQGGVDCALLLAEVYARAGAVPAIPTPQPYPPADLPLHRTAEGYVRTVLEHAREIAGPPEGPAPLPGDVVIWKWARAFWHAGIVTAWPLMIHASANQPVQEASAEQRGRLTVHEGQPRPRKFFRLSIFA